MLIDSIQCVICFIGKLDKPKYGLLDCGSYVHQNIRFINTRRKNQTFDFLCCLHTFLQTQWLCSKNVQYQGKAQAQYQMKCHAQNHIINIHMLNFALIYRCNQDLCRQSSERAVSRQCDGRGAAADKTCPMPDHGLFPSSLPL